MNPEIAKILDGGLGTELEKRGCNIADSLWSARALLESPGAIERIHLDYLEAGADCITTASYQVSFLSFGRAGLSEQDTRRALHNSLVIARRARKSFAGSNPTAHPLVAASVGPYGASLADGSEFHGNYDCSRQELADFHGARLRVLLEARPDLLACETLPSLQEAEVLLKLLRTAARVKAWFSFACRDEKHTVHGESIRECARMLDREDTVAAIGVNCTAPQLISSLVREIRPHTNKPIVVYPNAGQTWNAAKRRWEGNQVPINLGEMAQEWFALGATWVGGCCGFGPKDIREIRSRLARTRPLGKD